MQVEPSPQTGQGTPASLVVSLPFPHCVFQPGREQSADGSALLGGKNTCFAEKI